VLLRKLCKQTRPAASQIWGKIVSRSVFGPLVKDFFDTRTLMNAETKHSHPSREVGSRERRLKFYVNAYVVTFNFLFA